MPPTPCLAFCACAGLDEAILGNLGNGGSDSGGGGGGNPEEDSRKIADLLKHGAHCLHAMEAANEQVGAGLVECGVWWAGGWVGQLGGWVGAGLVECGW